MHVILNKAICAVLCFIYTIFNMLLWLVTETVLDQVL